MFFIPLSLKQWDKDTFFLNERNRRQFCIYHTCYLRKFHHYENTNITQSYIYQGISRDFFPNMIKNENAPNQFP